MATLQKDISAIKNLLDLNCLEDFYKDVFEYIINNLDEDIVNYDDDILEKFHSFKHSKFFNEEYKKHFQNIYEHIDIIKQERINIYYHKSDLKVFIKEVEFENIIIMSNLQKHRKKQLKLFYTTNENEKITINNKTYRTSSPTYIRDSYSYMILMLYITPECICAVKNKNPDLNLDSIGDYIIKNKDIFNEYNIEISIYDDKSTSKTNIKENIFNFSMYSFEQRDVHYLLSDNYKLIKAILEDRNYII
jgi:hypothetical protein